MTARGRPDRAGVRPKLEDAILDAAEILFGTRGPDGTSLRQIAMSAGSANHFAVQYHFQNKENLIAAIFERRLKSLDSRRGELLAKALGGGRERDVRTLMEIMLLPMSEEKNAAGRCSYAVFLLGIRMFSEFRKWRSFQDSPPVTREIENLLRVNLLFLSDVVFLERLNASITAFLAAVVDWDRRTANDPALRDTMQRQLQVVLDYAAAGMTAPAPAI